MPPLLVVGTQPQEARRNPGNPGRQRRQLRDLTHYPNAPEVVEDGKTFEENAAKKAVELAAHLHEWVLGEDSGLVVPALNGRPGVYSAPTPANRATTRPTTPGCWLNFSRCPTTTAPAYYVCTAASADPTGQVRTTAEGRCHGVILRERRGRGRLRL